MEKRNTVQTAKHPRHDVSIVVREMSPWSILREQIVDQRGRIEVKASDFEGRGAQHPLYRMLYIISKAHGAIDWFNGSPLGTTHGKSYYLNSHHIFPQSLLYKDTYNSESHVDRQKVNEIANRSFLTADTNRTISNKKPEEYLPDIELKYPGALISQFVPMDPNLWKLEYFEQFLSVRRDLIATKINEFMTALISEPEKTHSKPITELIPLGESLTLEFKSTLQWDIIQNAQNKALRHQFLKSIAAFLNTEGGTLIIGVEDDGSIYGIENDLKILQNSIDKFHQLLSTLVSDCIGVEYSTFIKTRFEQLKGKKICVIDVLKSYEPVYLKSSKGREFYVRVGNTTKALDTQQTVNFINMNWGG